MKKSKIFLKALAGIPMGIFIFELINIIISLHYGSYIRIECLESGLNLKDIIVSYLYCIISSYILGIVMFNSINIYKMELTISQKEKENNRISIPLLIILFVIIFVCMAINPDSYAFFGFIPSLIWSGIAMLFYAVKNLLDKYTLKEINKKLKEQKLR